MEEKEISLWEVLDIFSKMTFHMNKICAYTVPENYLMLIRKNFDLW